MEGLLSGIGPLFGRHGFGFRCVLQCTVAVVDTHTHTEASRLTVQISLRDSAVVDPPVPKGVRFLMKLPSKKKLLLETVKHSGLAVSLSHSALELRPKPKVEALRS